MKKSWSFAFAGVALLLAIVVGFLSFGRKSPPASSVIPPGSSAAETQDGSETKLPGTP